MNILLFLFSFIYSLIKKLLNTYYYIFKYLRKNYFDKYFDNNIDNLFSLISRIIILSVYEFLVFHIYIFYYLLYDNSIKIGSFGIFLRFINVFIISLIISFICDESYYIFIYLLELIDYILYFIIWVIALIFFIFSFDDNLKEIICFNKSFTGTYDLLLILFGVNLIFFIQIYRYIIIIFHFSNVFSIIRIIEIYKNKKEKLKTLFLSKSFLYVFFDIYILTPIYSFNFLFLPIFISSHINIYKKIFKNEYHIIEKEDKKFIYLFPKYFFIKNQILNDGKKIFIFFYKFFSNNLFFIYKYIKKILIYSFPIILTIISFPFIWRIKKSLKILIELFKTKQFKIFYIKYFKNIIKSLLEIVYFFIFILNHILPFHFKGIYDLFRKPNKLKKKYLHIIIFNEKWLDIIIFIFSLIRLITFNFYIYLIRKKGKIKYFSLLIDNENLIKNYSNIENRKKIIMKTNFDLLINLLIIIQILLGILNPFLTLKIINNLLLYFIIAKNNLNLKFVDLQFNFIYKSLKIIILILFVNFIYLPISLLLNIFAFWTFKYNVNLLILNNKKICNKFKNNKKNIENYLKFQQNKNPFSKYLGNLLIITESLIYGYKIIFEFIFINLNLLNIIRIFFFWSKLIKNNYESIEKLLDEQFILCIKEFIFTPFLFIFLILEPWNYKYHLEFFNEYHLENKVKKFYELIKIFLKDIFTVLILILLLISIIDTIPTILLIKRSIKKNIFPTEENILIYNLNYKTNDFKYELRQLYYKNVKKFTTTILFILNIFLITRIIPLFKRSKPFFIKFFKNLKNKIKDFINNFVFYIFCKKQQIIENDKLTKLPYHVLSEICFYLEPSDINNLSQVNKKLNLKTNINFIWEKLFYNKYDKKLKEVLKDEDYSLFNHNNYNSYKESCKNCYYILYKQDVNRRNELREKLINFSRVVEEETIESILNIPSLCMIPWKILGFILKHICNCIHKIFMFLFNIYLIIDVDFNSLFLNINNEYNEEYYFIIIIINIIIEIIFIIFLLIINILIFIIQLLSFDFVLEDNAQIFLKNYSFFYIILQLIYGFIFMIFILIIPILPSIYYILYDLNFKSKNNCFEFIKDLSILIYQSKFKIIIQIICGKYCLNIIFIFLAIIIYIIIMFVLIPKSKIIFIRIVYKLFDIFLVRNFNMFFFPLTLFLANFGLSFQCISIKIKNKFKIFFDIVLNIISLIICLIPFVFLFICYEKNLKQIIFIEIPLFIYIIFNWYLCGNVLKKLERENINEAIKY